MSSGLRRKIAEIEKNLRRLIVRSGGVFFAFRGGGGGVWGVGSGPSGRSGLSGRPTSPRRLDSGRLRRASREATSGLAGSGQGRRGGRAGARPTEVGWIFSCGGA